MKVKDLPKETNMGGLKVRTPEGEEGWWESQWPKGVWLSKVLPGTPGPRQVHPIFVTDLRECMEWDIIEPENQQP